MLWSRRKCLGLEVCAEDDFMLLQEGESELEEVERELGSKQAKTGGKNGINGDAGRKAGIIGHVKALFPPVFLEAFVLTFLAEWGDRSQVIILQCLSGGVCQWISAAALS